MLTKPAQQHKIGVSSHQTSSFPMQHHGELHSLMCQPRAAQLTPSTAAAPAAEFGQQRIGRPLGDRRHGFEAAVVEEARFAVPDRPLLRVVDAQISWRRSLDPRRSVAPRSRPPRRRAPSPPLRHPWGHHPASSPRRSTLKWRLSRRLPRHRLPHPWPPVPFTPAPHCASSAQWPR
jgi:hypothetical protein